MQAEPKSIILISAGFTLLNLQQKKNYNSPHYNKHWLSSISISSSPCAQKDVLWFEITVNYASVFHQRQTVQYLI